MRKTIIVLTLNALLFALSFPAGAQEAIYLVRHTEQAGRGNTNPPLTEAGEGRAKRLADVLKDAGIDVIFVTKTKRTVQTGELVEKALNVKVKVHPRKDVDGLLARLRTEHAHDRVLIVGHSRTVPRLLKAFGHPVKVKIARFEYDNLFVIIPQANGAPLVLQLRYGE